MRNPRPISLGRGRCRSAIRGRRRGFMSLIVRISSWGLWACGASRFIRCRSPVRLIISRRLRGAFCGSVWL
jgi:hypothetical protein